MPATANRNLTLTTVNGTVTVEVQYLVTFNQLERHMVANGLQYEESIKVVGEDPGTGTDQILATFPTQVIPVPNGQGNVAVQRLRQIAVTRAALQEDAGQGDTDEITCRIDITPVGLPVAISASTDQETLLG